MERLIGRVRAAGAEHELIAVGRSLGDAVGAGHAAGTADVLDNDLLSQELRQSRRDDPSDDVA